MTRREGGSRLSALPPLPPALQQHSQQVEGIVQRAIARSREQWIPFDEFVRIVQYEPGLGYYSAGSQKFGAGGDFTTAPELSPLFGRCVARQCAQVLAQCPAEAAILELGAGSGALAESILLALSELEQLPRHYWILEVSADLRSRQQARLSALPESLACRVQWLDSMPTAPINGVLLANEVMDALPFKRFLLTAKDVGECGVAASSTGDLIEAVRPADGLLRAEIERLTGDSLSGLSQDFVSELCPMLAPWIATLSAALGTGAVLLIDYGLARHEYYHPQRTRGTMRCHFRHHAHEDPLLNIGLQDISAWVDFTRLAEAADAVGLEVSGFCTQAAFLLATGIEADLATSRPAIDQARLASQARMLLLPGEMGETFKVMALTRAVDGPLLGFRYQDLRASL
jgi:SAM-dependent MidA family methyltransferase